MTEQHLCNEIQLSAVSSKCSCCSQKKYEIFKRCDAESSIESASNRFPFADAKLEILRFSSRPLSPRDSFISNMKRVDRKTTYDKKQSFASRGVCTEDVAFERLEIFAPKAAWMHR
ncbi:hypothetical protein CDAR_65931 [Caerostris darwini]|uniref:Uncharacterized protein n=1 Tax=Caerostris darwini TaxID=1538125 RepID=A0AAV4UCD8_9ARAC|nr:hypothetical protein CDAR_65931 [Caerostris darwini]